MRRRHFFYLLFIITLIFASAGIPVESRGSAALQNQAPAKKLSAGRNVNMVSGTTLPDGDPWLQRQNEPSLAVSTRNPLHILAGANDYRTVDMPETEGPLPGVGQASAAAGDAWLGVFKSFDGGESWKSTLIPGFPQDKSAQGMASKIKGYQAAADPVVRAGNNGLFYYSGMAFNRTNTEGAVFVSRFIDNNNDEKGDPIKYLDTTVIDSANGVRFKDKPWLAVDLPLDSLKTVLIDGQAIPRANVYVVYSVFTGSGDTLQSKILFKRSTDCGTTWDKPIEISKGDLLNQGASIVVDPRGNGFVYIAWRRFKKGTQSDAVIFSSSRDGGRSFQKAITPVASFAPGVLLDQPTAGDEGSSLPGTAFRSNAYPTMTVDKKGVVYIAWSQRGLGPAGDARIVLTTGTNGWDWTPPAPIDNPSTILGHQFMPSLTFAAAKVMAVWYDQRNDFAGQDGFASWINDNPLSWAWRHTLDIRAAQAVPGLSPIFGPSIQVSRYLFNLAKDASQPTGFKISQVQFNPPNYPLFKGGLVPFIGDYIDIAPSPTLVMTSDKKWRFNTEPSDTFAFHVAWTDNRDVRPPTNQNWTLYSPTDYTHPDFISRAAWCNGNGVGMRDQNIYTSRITEGVEAGTSANFKPLNLTVARAFSIFVKNTTDYIRAFRMTIANQPSGGSASFLQFEPLGTLDAKIAPYSTISRQVFVQAPDPKASVRVDIAEIDTPNGAVLAGGLKSFIEINTDPTNPSTVGDGIQYQETHNPYVGPPTVVSWTVDPNSLNPEIVNPNDLNLDLLNPDILSPHIRNESIGVVDPNVLDSNILNMTDYATPHIRNPDIINPHIRNTDIMAFGETDASVTDVEWTVKNDGNTASSYTFQTISKQPLPEGIYAQLLIYKVHYTPGVDDTTGSCALKQKPHHELLSNIVNPHIRNPHIRNLNILTPDVINSEVENATFSIPPGGEVKVMLRLIKPGASSLVSAKGVRVMQSTEDDLTSFLEAVGVAATAQSVNSEQADQGVTVPEAASSVLVIGTESALPEAVLGQAYNKALTAVGGKAPYAWWIDPTTLPLGLALNGATGDILGIPQRDPSKTYPSTYNFVVQVSDSSSPRQTDNQSFWITVVDPVVPPPALMISTASVPPGTVGAPYSSTLVSIGGVLPHRWELASGSLPDGLVLDSGGVISGTAGTGGTFSFVVRVTDSNTPTPQTATKAFTIMIATRTYSLSGRVVLGLGPSGIQGVVMRGLPNAPVTDENGFYADEIPEGWSGVVTPFLANYNISPPSKPYTSVSANLTGQDYSASVPNYILSGTVSQSGVPIAGVTMTFSNTVGTVVTDTNGFYQAVIAHGWSGTVIPFKDKFTFNPASRTFSPVISNQLAQNYAAIPAAGADDAFEENDTLAAAGLRPISAGTFTDLRLWDDDWFAIDLGTGQALKATIIGTTLVDINLEIYDSAGTYLSGGISVAAKDTAYAAGLQAGLYYIKVPYTQNTGLQNSYSLTVEVGSIALGDLAGKVTNPAGGGISTRVAIGEPSGVYLYQTLSNQNGDYRISLPPGYYMVWFDTHPQAPYYSGANYVGEWFDNMPTAFGTSLVFIQSGQTASGTNAMLSPGGAIEGRLTGSYGVGLSGASIIALGPNGTIISGAATNGNGIYSLARIPAGNFKIGFLPASGDDAAEFYADKPASASADTVDVQAGRTTAGIDAGLAAGGYISGRVTDPGGNGLENIRVEVYESSQKILLSRALTDAAGYYTAKGVPPGSFRVFFDAASVAAPYASKWYDAKLAYAEATAVSVETGKITPEINAQLVKGGSISGKVTDPSGSGLHQVLVSVFDLSGHELNSSDTDEGGNYIVSRIQPGNSRVLYRPAGGTYAIKWYSNQTSYGAATGAVVVADQTTANMNAQLAAGGSITGKVTTSAGVGIPGVVVSAYDASLNFALSYALTDATGNYTLARLATAKYKIEFNADNTKYVTKWYRDKTSYATASLVSVTAGGTTTGINGALAAKPTLAIAAATLPGGTVGTAFSAALQASGGSPFYRWSFVTGALPGGLTLSSVGVISGVPIAQGTFPFTVQVIDSSSPQQLDSRQFSITVVPSIVTTYTVSGQVTTSGSPVSGVVMNGLPTTPVTNAAGLYAATIPAGWSGTVIPGLAGFTFSPANRSYTSVASNQANQDYATAPVQGYDDPYDSGGQNNNDMAHASLVPPGTIANLKLLDDDWYKVNVAAGQDLRASIQGIYPTDIDVEVFDAAGNYLVAGISSRNWETVYASDLPAGTYYIKVGYFWDTGLQNVYSLTIETGNLVIGDLTGRATNTAGGGVKVRVEIRDPGGFHLFHTFSKDDGNFKISLPPADYIVRFDPAPSLPYYNGINTIGEWYDDLPSMTGAKIVSVKAGVITSGINAALAPAGAIEGRATDPQGAGVANALITVIGATGGSISSARSDASGFYHAERMPTGNYRVRFRTGMNDYAQKWHKSWNSFSDADTVPVLAGQTTTGIDVVFAPGGTISGKVADLSGNGMAGVSVEVYESALQIGVTTVQTAADGTYSAGHIPTGSYKLYFNSNFTSANHVSEWYNDKYAYAEAATVAVQTGQTTPNINVQLAAGGSISGKVTNPAGTGLFNVQALAIDLSGHALFSPIISTDDLGNYRLDRLPPGNLKLRVRAGTGTLATEWYNNKAAYNVADSISVPAGQTNAGINVQLDEGGSITGRVTNASGAGIPKVLVYAYDGSLEALVSSALTDAAGNFTITRIPTGSVKVYFNADYTDYAPVYYNNKPAYSSATLVSVTAGRTATALNVSLAAKAALAITTTTLPRGIVSTAYATTLANSGGTPLYNWKFLNGTLPNGLSLDGNGRIAGTPTVAGTFSFTAQVSDTSIAQQIVSKGFTIVVDPYAGSNFLVSGIVKLNTAPLAGILMNGLPGSPVTNIFGEYVAVVPPGWSGTVVPSLAGYGFTPGSRIYTNVTSTQTNQDFTAGVARTISGTITLGGTPLEGVHLNGLPGPPATGVNGFYTAAVPDGWTGTVTPTLTGFTFDPTSKSYSNVTSDQTGQNYAATALTGVDDAYEENDDWTQAKPITAGTLTDLVLADQDWFKFYVASADAGKDLKVHIKGSAYSDPTARHDMDFMILDQAGRLLSQNVSGGDDETAYIPNAAVGWYYIGQQYMSVVPPDFEIYALTVEVGKNFGIGYMSGQLTDEQGRGIANAYVELYGEPFNWDFSRPMVTTDASGNYKVGFAPGPYRVLFNLTNEYHRNPHCPDVNYIGKEYNKVLTIMPDTTISGINATLIQGGTITGRMTDVNGVGISNSVVRVYGANLTGSLGYTDQNGYYLVDRLRPGNYKVRFLSPSVNSPDPSYAHEWFDNVISPEEGLPVPVQAGAVTANINAQIDILWTASQGFIEGRVTDTSGNPITGTVVINAYDSMGIQVARTVADAAGNYRIQRIPPGPTRLFFSPPAVNPGFVSEYYPDKFTLVEAVPVMVAAGQTVSGINAQLAQGGAIAGRIMDSSGIGLPGITVSIVDIDTNRTYGASTDAAGNYTMLKLMPDDYKLVVRPNPGVYTAEWYSAKSSFTTADVVAVRAGQTLPGLDARITGAGGSVSGTVTNGSIGVSDVYVNVLDGTKGIILATAATGADGTYSISHATAGQDKLSFNPDANFLGYVQQFFQAKATYETADLVTVTPGQATTDRNAILGRIPELAITPASLPAGEMAKVYSATLPVTGGRPFYYWAVVSGSLPDGLTLKTNGVISGTPTVAGSFNFTVRVTDSTYPQLSTERAYTMMVNAYSGLGYTISGLISLGGSPLAGVVLNGLPGNPITGASGRYLAIVSPGWSGTVTPTLAGYAFNPPNKTYSTVAANLQGQDYTASVGYVVSGTVKINGGPFPDALMSSLPGNPRTDANGFYTAAVPSGWSGTVTPTVPGFTFVPPNRTYANVTANQAVQDYTVTFQGGVDDTSEENDTFATAKIITPGTYTPLVANDEDWFKISVSADDAGKDLKVHIKGLSCPNPAIYHDLDFYILNSSQKLMGAVMSSSDDETLYISGIAAGWYYINQHLTGQIGAVYALTVEIGNNFGIGHVSGRVTDALGRGIENVFIELQQEVFNWGASWPMVTTDANGNFNVGYAPGKYRIQYNTNNLSSYDDSRFPNANYLGSSSADVVTLSAGTTLTGIDAQLDEAGSISGRMTDPSGNGMALSFVYAYNSNNQQPSFAWTKPDGTYRISHLPTGNYKLRFRSSVADDYANIWYDNSLTPDGALPVPVQAGSTTVGIDARLVNWTDIQGFVNGRVTDSSGNPIQGVTVAAYDSAGISVSSGRTDSAGNYGIWHLAPGPVRIFFNAGVATVSGSYASEYYPDKPTLGEAIPVLVQSGQTIYGIDAQLAAAGTITGRVTDPSGNGLYGVNVAAVDINSDKVYEASTDIAGNYARRNIPPGSYRVRFRPGSGDFAVEWYNDKTSFSVGNTITVVAGQTHTGIDAQIAANGGSITGRVTNGVAGAWGVFVYALDGVKPVVVSSARTAPDGSYTMRRLPTGTAKVQFNTDLNLLGFASEYYDNRGTFGAADPVQTTMGQTTTLSDGVLAPIPALTITTASLPNGQQSTFYSASLEASGGRPFYFFSLESGALPNGLILNGKGEIRGNPTAAGTFNFTVRVIDSTRPRQSTINNYVLTILAYQTSYDISGHVAFSGSPLAGVVMNGLPGPPVTDVSGHYIGLVSPGWSGTVTPVKEGYAFSPANKTYSTITAGFQNEDYSAVIGHSISGIVTHVSGTPPNVVTVPYPGVLMSGLPGNPRTDASGMYSMAVPHGWSGTVTPTVPGSTFSPVSRTYANVTSNQTLQDYTASYLPGVDDAYEDNDSFEAAKAIPLGTTTNLVLNDEDWFKVQIGPADAGKDLKVRIKGIAYPQSPSEHHDMDLLVVDQTGKLMGYNVSASDDEIAFITNIAPGWYYIDNLFWEPSGVYSLTVETGTNFGIGYISGRLTDEENRGIVNAYVELYGEPLDTNVARPLITTDVDGYYKVGFTPGNYRVLFNMTNNNHVMPYFPDVNYIGQEYSRLTTITAGTTAQGVNAQLMRGGAISGYVTDPAGTLTNSFVYLYASDNSVAGFTRAYGNYIVDRIRPGNYIVRFRPFTSNLATQWYDNARAPETCLPVPVRAGETTPNINALFSLWSDVEGFIEGHVTNMSGNPIPGVGVSTYHTNGIAISGATATTDATGHYLVRVIAPGLVKIFFKSPSTANYVSEYFPDELQIANAVPVMVQTGQMVSGIDVQLAAAGNISGRLTDASGNGLYRAGVVAYDIGTDRFHSVSTDAAGNYMISNLLPGDYKVRFNPVRGSGLVEWFNDKVSFSAGDKVTVTAGNEVSNINAQVADGGGSLSGRVTSGVNGAGIGGISINVLDSVKKAVISSALTDPDGHYSVPYMSTSEVKVNFITDTLYLDSASKFYNDEPAFEGADLVQATKGGTTADINAVLGLIPALTMTTTSLLDGEIAVPYVASLQASGGRPFYHFRLESGSLPNGLTINGKGEIQGTPTAMGTFNFTVRATDSTRPQQFDSQALAITIRAYPGLGHTISGKVMAGGSPIPGVVMDGLPGSPVTNILGEYVAVVPPGWSGTVSPFLGTYSFAPPSRTYTNLTSSLAGEDFAAYVGSTLYVSTGGVPSGRTGSSYGYTMVAQGGTPPYSWTAASGRLPAGLTLNTSGQISGSPTEGGEFPWTVRATDSSSPPLSATRSLSLIINPAHQASWTTTYPLGGQVNPMGLVRDPVNPGTMYAVVNNRGIYRSTNGGANWTNFTETATAGSGTWFDAKYLNVFVIGHESQFYMAGNWGLFKSLNQGAYWTRIDAGFSGEVMAIALNPANGNMVYAGTREGKVYKSENGGSSWTDFSGGLPAGEIHFLAVDPVDPSKIYAGTGSTGIYRSTLGGAWVSINGVWAGDSSNTNLIRVETIVINPANTAQIFIAGEAPAFGYGIFKTDIGGATWSPVTPQVGYQWGAGYRLAINPADPSVFYAINGRNVRIYTSGGAASSDYYVAASNLSCLAVDPVTLALYAGTDGDGLFKSSAGGQTWTAVNNNIRAQSFPNFRAHSLHIDSSNPDIIYAGSMGGGYRSLDGGDSWVKMDHPDWGIRAFATHPSIPGTVFSIGNWVYKNTAFGNPGSWTDPSGGAFSGFRDSDLVIVPGAPNVLYAGVYGPDSGKEGVWKSLDGGATWAPKNVGLTDTKINTLTIHPSLPNILFASTRLQDPTQQGLNTRLFRTMDGGESWQQVMCGLPDTLGVTQVVFAPSDPNIMYLSATGWNRGLYKSADGGGCWAKLNNYNIAAVAVHPANPDIVYLGIFGSPGFYVSFNGGQTYTQFNAGLHPNPWVDSIALDPRNPLHVFLGTNAGVYETTLAVDMVISTTALPNAVINQAYSAGLKAVGGTPPYTWSLPSPGSLPFGIAIETATGMLNGQPNTAGSFALEVKVVDSNGRSFTKSLTLNVLAMYPLAANPAPPEGGTVTRTPDEPLYTQGSIVKVTAVPNPGYAFIGWSGGISGTASTELVVMVESKAIQANFAPTSALPDYHVSSASFPATAAAGEIISGSVNIAIGNLGAGTVNPPAVSAGVYLSKDALITPEDTLLWKGRVFFAPPGSGETRALPIDPGLQIPTTLAAGTYTIGVLVDDINGVVEGNEGNNVSSRTITISTTGFSHLELLGGWPYGSTIGVDADASRQVVLRGHGGLVEIVDISNPSRPRVISQLNVGPGQVNGIKIIGNLAYFAGGTKFFIADISDLHNPQIIGSCGGLLSNIRDLDISGNHAFVSDYHYGLRVIDISMPTAPAVVGSLPLPDCRTRLVRAFGNIVYVTRYTHVARPYGVAGLSIVDVSDPAHPVERTFLQNLSVGDLAVDKTGRYLFVMGQNTSLKIYDVLNPAAPIEVASYGGTFSPGGIKVIGDRAYFTDAYQNKAVILDISDPIHPVEISIFQFLDSTALARPAAAGNLCLVPSWYDALRIVDFSNLGSPAQVGILETVGLSNHADVANGQAYVATSRTTSDRLKVLNLANLSNITQTASLETSYGINDVVANGIRAYLAGGGAGLRAIDISNPARPVEDGSSLSAPQAQDIVISGNYAYVADGYNGLKIFDIRTPGKPGLLGACPTSGYAYQLAVSGTYAYLACDTQGLRIIDISDPQNPHIVGSRVFSESAYNVAVSANHAYVVNYNNDIIWVVDVSNPANPVERASRNVYFCYGDIGFSGRYMFVPNTFFGLKIFDISDPANPVEVAIDRRLASACDVIVRENLIYVVDRDAGLYVLEFRNPIFTETFESSPVGSIPSGWSVLHPGVSIATSNTRAYEGGKSLYIRGSPYNGANLNKSVSDLNISSGVYRLSFSMSADPVNWTGGDGQALGHVEIQGYIYAMGIRKFDGLFKLCMCGASEKTIDFPGSVSALNKYEVLIDLDSKSADFYFNGTKVGSNIAEYGSASNRIGLAAGNAGPPGGCPTAYFDFVTLEKIR